MLLLSAVLRLWAGAESREDDTINFRKADTRRSLIADEQIRVPDREWSEEPPRPSGLVEVPALKILDARTRSSPYAELLAMVSSY